MRMNKLMPWVLGISVWAWIAGAAAQNIPKETHWVARKHINNGLQDMAEKKYYWAKKEFEFVMRMQHDSGLKCVAFLNHGVINYIEGNIDQAISDYKSAIRFKPDYAEAYFNLGSVYYKRGNFKGAEEAYLKAIQLQPEYGRAHYSLGNVYLDQRKYDLAEKHANLAAQYGVGYKTLKEKLKSVKR
ncbi:MAG: tetratricopeptide repeat protein [Candidatus Binatia bacterium]